MYIDNNKEILNFKFVMCVPTHTSQVSFHFNELFIIVQRTISGSAERWVYS